MPSSTAPEGVSPRTRLPLPSAIQRSCQYAVHSGCRPRAGGWQRRLAAPDWQLPAGSSLQADPAAACRAANERAGHRSAGEAAATAPRLHRRVIQAGRGAPMLDWVAASRQGGGSGACSAAVWQVQAVLSGWEPCTLVSKHV